MTDEQLVADGSDAAFSILARRYRPTLRIISRKYSTAWLTHDDLYQEALLGLWEATVLYDVVHKVKFRSFANLVVTRRVQDTVKYANRGKHRSCSMAIEAARRDGDLDEPGPYERYVDRRPGPCERVIITETLAQHMRVLTERLTVRQSTIVTARLNGLTLREAGELVTDHAYAKSADNILQRVRSKLRAAA